MLTVITPAPSRDLATLAEIKLELELSGTADDAVLGSMIRQASADIVRYTNRQFLAETVRETFRLLESAGVGPCGRYPTAMDGLCRAFDPLLLSRSPVIEVLSVEEAGAAVAPAEYELEPELGLLHRVEGAYHTGWFVDRVAVEYRAGYEPADLPEDIRRACIDLVKYRYFSRSRDPALRSERILDVIDSSFTSASSASTKRGLPLDVAERLDNYRRFDL